jgi:uncharacterized membrane protein (DUF2068 family)
MPKRPSGLIAIVAYKTFTATIFAITSVSILFTINNHEGLQEFAESLALEGKKGIVAWLLEKLLNINARTLLFASLATAVYTAISAIEAVGLWFEKEWARWLVIGVVTISIPFEIFEIIKGISPVKLIVFILNIAIFIYLIREFPQADRKDQPQKVS